MRFTETPLGGAYLIDLEKRGDERGFFARAFCSREFSRLGLTESFVQMNDSLSESRGTLRGMHYQLGDSAETKLVRCIRGSIWDCILDLRSKSPTFGQWYGAELSADNRKAMYVPKGFAHGFITLEDQSEVLYQVDEFYSPDNERGIRWNDTRFKIVWPLTPRVVSERDHAHKNFSPEHHLGL